MTNLNQEGLLRGQDGFFRIRYIKLFWSLVHTHKYMLSHGRDLRNHTVGL
jgi:hypothetical protein